MNKIFLLFFAYLALLLSCRKEKKPKVDFTYTGTLSAIKNGINWSAKVRFVNENDSIYIEANVYNEFNYLRQTLAFFKIPKTIGIHLLKKFTPLNNLTSSTYGTSQDDGDVSCDNFTLDTLRMNNYIKVTSIDNIAKTIRCEFVSTYFIDNISGRKCNPNEVDTIKFTNGIIQGSF